MSLLVDLLPPMPQLYQSIGITYGKVMETLRIQPKQILGNGFAYLIPFSNLQK